MRRAKIHVSNAQYRVKQKIKNRIVCMLHTLGSCSRAGEVGGGGGGGGGGGEADRDDKDVTVDDVDDESSSFSLVLSSSDSKAMRIFLGRPRF